MIKIVGIVAVTPPIVRPCFEPILGLDGKVKCRRKSCTSFLWDVVAISHLMVPLILSGSVISLDLKMGRISNLKDLSFGSFFVITQVKFSALVWSRSQERKSLRSGLSIFEVFLFKLNCTQSLNPALSSIFTSKLMLLDAFEILVKVGL